MQQVIHKFKLFVISVAIFLFIIILTPLPAFALSVQDVPNPRQTYGGWVTDMAGVLRDDTEQQLDRMITKFESKTTIEIAVVTVVGTQPSPSPKAFTTELFNTWKIGKARQNNGLLFLISVGDRRVEIETGSGLENLLSTSTLQKLLATQVTPELSQNNFDAATLAGTEALIDTLSNKIFASSAAEGHSTAAKFPYFLLRMFLTAGIAIGFTAISIFLRRQYRNYHEGQVNQNLRKTVSPAGLGEQGWGMFLDLILLLMIYSIVAFVIVEPYKSPLVLNEAKLPIAVAIALMSGNLEGALDVGVLIGWSSFGAALLIYRTIAEAGLKCTFGQLVAGVRVVSADDSMLGVTNKRLRSLKNTEENSISFQAALIRNLMFGIDGFLLYLVGAVAILRSDRSQRLGDRLAKTVVVCRQITSPEQQRLDSAYIAGGAFGLTNIGGDFGGGTSDGGGSGSDF